MHFDLLALGSGPAGQRAAIQASKLGKRAAVAERMSALGGVSIHLGTIPSKTLREAVVYLSGYHQRTFYGRDYAVDPDISVADLMLRIEQVVRNEVAVTREHLLNNGIEVLAGEASFTGPHTVSVVQPGGLRTEVSADFIVIATGSEAVHDPRFPYDGTRVLDSNDLLRLPQVPDSLIVVGAGIIGTEYAGIFTALGVPVTLIDRRDRLLPFLDREIGNALTNHLLEGGLDLRLQDDVASVDASSERGVALRLASGAEVRAAAVLSCVGRRGATDGLHLEAAGLAPDERGRIPVNEHYQTAVPHIYAAGDVIGAPSLAATSMEQGRIAACHAFGAPEDTAAMPLPYAVYTVPEVAMLGPTGEELDAAGVDYVTGRGSYREVARGQMLGDHTGFLKLLFHAPTGRLLAVHAIGAQASELVHIGQAVMAFGGGIDYFVDAVFNYPTLAECYKAATLDAANDLRRAGRYGQVQRFQPAPKAWG